MVQNLGLKKKKKNQNSSNNTGGGKLIKFPCISKAVSRNV